MGSLFEDIGLFGHLVLPVPGGGDVGRLDGPSPSPSLQVVDGDGPVGHPRRQHVRVPRVDVNAHDAAVSAAEELGVRGVLQGEDAHEAGTALVVVKVVFGEERVGLGYFLTGFSFTIECMMLHTCSYIGDFFCFSLLRCCIAKKNQWTALSQFLPSYKCNALTRSERGRKQVVVCWVPAYCGDLHPLGALEAKLPQREKCPLRLAEFVRGVLPVLKICTKEQSFPACCSIFQLDFLKKLF